MSVHALCAHPKTKAARAACRRAASKGVTPTATVAPAPTAIQTPIAETTTTREIAERAVSLSAQIDAFQLEAVSKRVEKINARAESKGLVGMLRLTAEPVECREVDDLTKLERTWVEYAVKIDGTAPAHNGWEFIAQLDWDENAGLIVRSIPGAAMIDRDSVREGWCDHCKTTRRRLVTYVVRHQESGNTLQVGSSCLKDFTGQFATLLFPTLPSDEEREGWIGEAGEREYDPRTVLAVAWACVKLEGFKPASNQYGTTRDDVLTALYPGKSKVDQEFARKIAPVAEEATEKASQLLAWILSDDFSGESEYVFNLKSVAAGERVSRRNIGLLASAPQAWSRALERSLVRDREASVYKDSKYVGTAPNAGEGVKGSREVLTVEIQAVRFIRGDYGTSTLYTMTTEDGNVVKWFASSDRLGEKVGARFIIRGTVKSHDEWQGMKTTKLTRCAILDEL